MDDALRNNLWNCVAVLFPKERSYSVQLNAAFFGFAARVWVNFFRRPLDEIENKATQHFYSSVRDVFMKSFEWYEVYDFIEFLAQNVQPKDGERFMEACNAMLEAEGSAYRIVGGLVTALTSEEEISAVEQALQNPLGPVQEHVKAALDLLSDRNKPDYRNSVKESISAVEAACRAATGKRDFKDALKALEASGFELHPAQREAFLKLYGYTSDEGGVRHALTDEAQRIDHADALFMLVVCSAFTNFLVAKAPPQS